MLWPTTRQSTTSLWTGPLRLRVTSKQQPAQHWPGVRVLQLRSTDRESELQFWIRESTPSITRSTGIELLQASISPAKVEQTIRMATELMSQPSPRATITSPLAPTPE